MNTSEQSQVSAGLPHGRQTSIWRALGNQSAVVYALLVTGIRSHYKSSRLGYLWELIDPLMQILIWFALVYFLRGPRFIYDMSTFLFLGTGIVGFFFFRRIAQDTLANERRQAAFTKLPNVRRIDLLLAGGLSESVVLALVATILWTSIVFADWGIAPDNLLGVIAACASLGALGFGFGHFNSAAISLMPVYEKLLPIIFRILFFTSGAIFPIERLPPNIFGFLQWNPVYHGIDMIRSAWSFTYTTRTSSYLYAVTWATGFFLLGLLLDKHALRARARMTA